MRRYLIWRDQYDMSAWNTPDAQADTREEAEAKARALVGDHDDDWQPSATIVDTRPVANPDPEAFEEWTIRDAKPEQPPGPATHQPAAVYRAEGAVEVHFTDGRRPFVNLAAGDSLVFDSDLIWLRTAHDIGEADIGRELDLSAVGWVVFPDSRQEPLRAKVEWEPRKKAVSGQLSS